MFLLSRPPDSSLTYPPTHPLIHPLIYQEMSAEPGVRNEFRKIIREKSTISTLPTAKGVATITPFSEHFGIHYLERKPVKVSAEQR